MYYWFLQLRDSPDVLNSIKTLFYPHLLFPGHMIKVSCFTSLCLIYLKSMSRNQI